MNAKIVYAKTNLNNNDDFCGASVTTTIELLQNYLSVSIDGIEITEP